MHQAELQDMLAKGTAVRVGMTEYNRMLDSYAPGLKAKILKDWGPPEKSKLMMSNGPGRSGDDCSGREVRGTSC